MATTHTFTNASSFSKVLGNNFVVAPGASIDLQTTDLIAQDLTEITAGVFTVNPALPSDISESVGESDKVAKLIKWCLSRDTDIEFDGAAPTAGTAGGAAVSVDLHVLDADSVIDVFNDVFQVTVTSSLSGLISFDGSTPASAAVVTFTDGVATIEVTDAVAETAVLTLSSGPAGITITDTHSIVFS